MSELDYEKNFLINVICEFDFSPVENFLDNIGSDTNFQEEFSSNIENYNSSDIVFDKEIKKDLISIKFRKGLTICKSLDFYNNKIILKYGNYAKFNTLYDDVNAIMNFFQSHSVLSINFINLRFINQIELDGSFNNLEGYINKSLYENNYPFFDKTNIKRVFHILDFSKDDFNIQFQFGQFNSDFPSIITKNEFILDYSCDLDDEININNIPSIISNMSKSILELMDLSLDYKLKDLLEVFNNE